MCATAAFGDGATLLGTMGRGAAPPPQSRGVVAQWTEVRLPPLTKGTTYWVVLYGTYANSLFTTLAAVFGTAASNPTIAAGYKGQPWQENLVGAGFLSVAVSIIIASILVLWGLRTGISLHESQQR
jgi:hypothetical protein